MALKDSLASFSLLMVLTFTLTPQRLQMVEAQTDERGLTTQKAQQKESRIALVIGNSAYKDAPLQNPVNDARDMAHALRELGFDVIYGENLSQNEIKRSIRSFGDKIHNGGVGLFYYAGHGIQVNGVNYLVPVGATITKEEEVEYESVDVGFVLAQMESAKNRLNIVILDACRNNPFARSFRSTRSGLASIDAPSGTVIAYSTAPGSVASDGHGRNGIYTQELLKQIRMPSLNIEQVFKQVRVAVRNITQSKQTPWESSSLIGDFRFIDTGETVTEINSSLRPQPASPPLLPSVDDVLENFFRAIGGKNAINQVSTLEKKGLYIVTQGEKRIEGKVESYQKKPGKSLMVIKAGNAVTKEVFDGNRGWIYGSKTGTQSATARQLDLYQRSMAWEEGDINKIKQLYSKIIVRGKEKLGERDVFVIDAATPDNKTESFFFDAQTGLLTRGDVVLDSVATQSGVAAPTQIYFDDYAEVSGMKIPLTTRQVFIGMTITLKYDILNLRFNIPLNDKLFTKP